MVLRYYLFIFSLFYPSYLASCDFKFMNNGEDLFYLCENTQEKVKIIENKVYINNKKANSIINNQYRSWLKSRENNTKYLKNKKDKFNCF